MKSVAQAHPEKRLFIALLTRDITLIEAILDLIDNSINSAVIIGGNALQTPRDFLDMIDKPIRKKGLPEINIDFTGERFDMFDSCGGISFHHARDSVFRFGRTDDDEDDSHSDTLSVYGIGLKRALFKLGNKISIFSNHRTGGFKTNIDVAKWESTKQDSWTIPIESTDISNNIAFGTKISVKELYSDITKRMNDDGFLGLLMSRIARTYGYFLGRVVDIYVRGEKIAPIDIRVSDNRAYENFSVDGVDCGVLAGIRSTTGKFYQAEDAGWYIYCNGRAVAFADKSDVTGWGTYLPSFQPKHRPFVGFVFFTSPRPEQLPWTTTKAAINQESGVWQHALRVMSRVGRQVTGFLDNRYTSDGTLISSDELGSVTGSSSSALRAISDVASRTFVPPRRVDDDTTSIQYKAKKNEIDEVKKYLGKRALSNGETGRYTFDYFLKNVVRE
jgi:hypothetical protein